MSIPRIPVDHPKHECLWEVVGELQRMGRASLASEVALAINRHRLGLAEEPAVAIPAVALNAEEI